MSILGQKVSAASTQDVLYTAPAGKRAILRVILVNKNGSAANVSLYLLQSGDSTSPIPDSRKIDVVAIADDTTSSTSEIVLDEGQSVYFNSDLANVILNANGFTEDK